MKLMKIKLAVLTILLSISCFAISKPNACPKISALKAVGVKHAETSLMGWQVYSDPNNFNTNELWAFVMLGDDKSQSEEEAIAKANANIGSLVLYSGPDKSSRNWECTYALESTNEHIFGIAATEPCED
jgi:hypothetical protein